MDGMIATLPRASASRTSTRRGPTSSRAAMRAAKLREEAALWRNLAERRRDHRDVPRMLRWAEACEREAAVIEAAWARSAGRAGAA